MCLWNTVYVNSCAAVVICGHHGICGRWPWGWRSSGRRPGSSDVKTFNPMVRLSIDMMICFAGKIHATILLTCENGTGFDSISALVWLILQVYMDPYRRGIIFRWNRTDFAFLAVTVAQRYVEQCQSQEIWVKSCSIEHKWKHFPRYWPFVQGIHRSPLNSPHKGQWHGVWYFLWSTPE